MVRSFLPLRKTQIVINTWHGGGAYKRCKIKSGAPLNTALSHINLFLSSSELFSRGLLGEDFHFQQEILNCGMPRNDILFLRPTSVVENVKLHLGIPLEKKMVLFAPTWRESRKASFYQIDVPLLLAALELKFGGRFVFAYRFHEGVDKLKGFDPGPEMIRTNSYEDMQEVLLATDVLITDYSSSLWDFSLLGRPCFIYATDLKEYAQERQFYMPIEAWPFPLSQNYRELVENVATFDQPAYLQAIKRHHDQLHSFETGHACAMVAKRIHEIVFKAGEKI
jgi:CDP-glycerol glycerophosphotransferase